MNESHDGQTVVEWCFILLIVVIVCFAVIKVAERM